MMRSVSDGQQSIDYGYDEVYQLTQEVVQVNGSVTTNYWSYDAAGNVLTATGPFGRAQASANADNELTAWTQTVNQLTATGQVDPGPRSNKWYDSTAQARGQSAPVATSDGAFSILGVPVSGGANALTVTVHDVSGNTATQVVNFTVTTTSYWGFTHDSNGNLSGRTNQTGTVWSYQYDAENRLVRAVSNSVAVLECWYDGFGRRVAKQETIGAQTTTMQYIWDGWTLVAVLGEDGHLLEYCTRGVGMAGDIGSLVTVTHWTNGNPTAMYYLHNNHRGDVIMARQGTNTVAALDYTPYGELRSQTGTYTPRFRFSSKEYEASTGVYHFPYRYYAPQCARWITRDPIGELGAQLIDSSTASPVGQVSSRFVDGENTFAFVRNNPVSYTDSLGLLTFHGCSPTQQGLLESAFRTACERVASEEFARCLGDDRLVQQLRQMCSSSAPHIVCDSLSSAGCSDGNTCGYTWRTSGRTIHICPAGFDSGQCGSLGSTIMHELTHTRGHPDAECPDRVERCLGL